MVAAVVGSVVLAVHVARDGGGEVEGDGRAHQVGGGESSTVNYRPSESVSGVSGKYLRRVGRWAVGGRR